MSFRERLDNAVVALEGPAVTSGPAALMPSMSAGAARRAALPPPGVLASLHPVLRDSGVLAYCLEPPEAQQGRPIPSWEANWAGFTLSPPATPRSGPPYSGGDR